MLQADLSFVPLALQNWLSNEEKVLAKYGSRWFRIWSFFLASATIVSRQGGASVFQLTLHKNTNGFDRAQGIASHVGTRYTDNKEWKCVLACHRLHRAPLWVPS